MDINIPSQVKTFANLSAFPTTGSLKTIYIAEDSDIAYYWTGSAYQAISVQDISGLQSKPVVVNASLTAQNDNVYHVVANATFTDPTPVEGRGYVVFVRNGTATIGGIPQSNNSIYYRLFLSGAWVTYRFDNSVANNNNFVPQSRTINGKALTSNVTLTPSDIGAPSGSGTSTGTNTGDQTFITPRVQSVTSSATVTPTSVNDIVTITAQAEGLTLANPTGTLLEGQSLIIRIKDNGTARTIGYGSDYRAIGVTLPTTTVVNKTTYLGCIWNATDSKLDIVGVCIEA
jgi:hypothetical protein